ncbi:MAG: dihydrofolate reductase [Bacteroidetes bacterium]|nr:dihydrofolate reductase [Bacteroidota bacterium]
MKISIVVAISENNAIGKNGDLLWRLPADMKHFKEITYGHHVLMGRKTFESIPPKFRPLNGRVNVIVTRQKDFVAEGCKVVSSVEEGIQFSKDNGETELMIIGGGEIYSRSFQQTDKIYLTKVLDTFPDADAFFPAISDSEWKALSTEKYSTDEKHTYSFDFIELERK